MNYSLSLWQRLARATTPLARNQTLTYYAAFIALGLTTASLGPTLLGLADQTGSAMSQISFLFTARAFGYMVGAFVGGRLYDRLPGHRTMAAALLVISCLLAGVPFISLLWLLAIVLLGVGFMESVVDVGANTLIVWVHRERVAPYMNGLHLFFAVGAFLSPLLVAQAILITGNFGWSYWLLALLLVPVVIRLLPLESPQPIISAQEQATVRPNYLLIFLFAAFFMAITSAESSFGGWIFTYTVKANLAGEATAAYVNAAFWGAFVLGRVVSIPLSTRLRPRVIIFGDLILAISGIAVMLVLQSSPVALWIGTILFGLGIASTFPTILTFAGRHMTITGAVTGWFFVGASLGGMILPWAIGQLFERIGPISVMIVIGGAVVMAFVVFALILMQIRRDKVAGPSH